PEQAQPPRKPASPVAPHRPPAADVLQPYHIFPGRMPHEGDAIRGRKSIVHGTRTTLSISKPTESMPKETFFRNGERHEVYFVQDGEGVVRSEYGDLKFRKNVYVAMPKGTTYRIELASPKAWFLLVESMYPINFAPHYFNKEGQATLMSPVVETEIETPELPAYRDERGEFPVDVKHAGGKVTRITRGPREGAGPTRGDARHVLREHANHDVRVRPPRPLVRAELGGDCTPCRGEGRGMGVAVRVMGVRTMQTSANPIRLVSGTFPRGTLDRILVDARPFTETGHFLYPADADGNHTKGFFAIEPVTRSAAFVDA